MNSELDSAAARMRAVGPPPGMLACLLFLIDWRPLDKFIHILLIVTLRGRPLTYLI